jgi:hypothetical protein
MMGSNDMFAVAAFKNVLLTGLVAIFVMAVVRVCIMTLFIMVNFFAVIGFVVIARAVTGTIRRVIPVSVTV